MRRPHWNRGAKPAVNEDGGAGGCNILFIVEARYGRGRCWGSASWVGARCWTNKQVSGRVQKQYLMAMLAEGICCEIFSTVRDRWRAKDQWILACRKMLLYLCTRLQSVQVTHVKAQNFSEMWGQDLKVWAAIAGKIILH